MVYVFSSALGDNVDHIYPGRFGLFEIFKKSQFDRAVFFISQQRSSGTKKIIIIISQLSTVLCTGRKNYKQQSFIMSFFSTYFEIFTTKRNTDSSLKVHFL